jgi:hypothetical protein
MNKEELFKIFEDEDIDKKSIVQHRNILSIGMFIKIITNHQVFHKKLEAFFKQEVQDYDVNITEQVSRGTVYNRSWFHINQLDITDSLYEDILYKFNYDQLYHSLTSAIQYFEELEEYEKCAFLHKIQIILEKGKE